MGTKLYSVGDPVVCHTFGSVRGFRAVIEQTDPLYFRDRQGTLITPADVVSFEHKPRMAKFGCVVRLPTDEGTTRDRTLHFSAPAVLEHKDELFDVAKARASKRWKEPYIVEIYRR